MRVLWGAKKKERHKSHSGTDQSVTAMLPNPQKRELFSPSSLEVVVKCIYTSCMNWSEPWSLALWAFCYIQIRTVAFTLLSSQRGAGASHPRAACAMWGFPLLFQYTIKRDSWHCRWLILICLLLHKERGSWNVLVLVTFPSSYPAEQASPASSEGSQWDILCSHSVARVA